MNCGRIKLRGGQILYVFHHFQAVFFPVAIETNPFCASLEDIGLQCVLYMQTTSWSGM